MTAACLVFGCGAPVTARGRCAKHARQVDAARSLGADRQAGKRLYATRQWRDLRAALLGLHVYCECRECVTLRRPWPSEVVHHLRPHGGDPRKFFDPHNLQVLAKVCHDRLTAGASGGRAVLPGSTPYEPLLGGARSAGGSGQGAGVTKGGVGG